MRPPGSRARPSIPRAASCGRERHKRSPCVTITPLMKVPKKISRLFREPPRTLFDDLEDVTAEAPVKGPLFSTPVFYALLAVFGTSLMLTADWIGLLLLNSEGVFGRIGPLNTVRVTAVLMTGIAIPSALLMFHYKRLYSYTSDENVFFAVTFSLSFFLGSPCVLTGIFG